MALLSMLPHAEFRPDDHWEDALHFISNQLVTGLNHFLNDESKKYLDISPNESLFIKNGESCVEIFDPELSEVRRSISTTTTPQVAKFFPSGQVLLIADHNILRIADVGSGTVVRNVHFDPFKN